MWNTIVFSSALLLASVGDATCTGGASKGTFRYPPAIQSYWVPDKDVDLGSDRGDIETATRLGAGGVDFLPFFEYGGALFPVPPSSNWSTGASGNRNWNESFLVGLNFHQETGMLMDFALGPNQRQGIPSAPDEGGIHWDLISTIFTCLA